MYILPVQNKSFVAVSAAFTMFSALTSDRQLTIWGYNRSGLAVGDVPEKVQGRAVSPVTFGDGFNMVRTVDGQVEVWQGGGGAQDVCNLTQFQAQLQGEVVRALAAGQWHALALLANGTVVGGGCDGDGQATVPAPFRNLAVTSIAASYNSSYAATTVCACPRGFQALEQ
jgi:hypothetical protein